MSPTTWSLRQVCSLCSAQQDVLQVQSESRPCTHQRLLNSTHSEVLLIVALCETLWKLEVESPRQSGFLTEKDGGWAKIDVGDFEVISLWCSVLHCGFFPSGVCCVHQRERALHSHPQDDRRGEGVRNYRTRWEHTTNWILLLLVQLQICFLSMYFLALTLLLMWHLRFSCLTILTFLLFLLFHPADERYIHPQQDKFSIQLISPVSWEAIPNTR